jgi:hypothetical protein
MKLSKERSGKKSRKNNIFPQGRKEKHSTFSLLSLKERTERKEKTPIFSLSPIGKKPRKFPFPLTFPREGKSREITEIFPQGKGKGKSILRIGKFPFPSSCGHGGK